MDLTPLYELRDRLRSSVIAGAALAAGDFRLKRAVENFAPFEKAAPVFARLGQTCRALLSPDCPDRAGALLDAISLADAVLCTQAAVNVPGEAEPLPAAVSGAAQVNAPYSVLAPLLEALTTSGSGKFSFVMETHDQRPELFDDYRVRGALVRALGAAYGELADKAQQWLTGMGESVLPLLMDGFDPKGKKDMVRRVQVIEAVAGAGANDFYLAQLPDAEKEVRAALIFALRHDVGNAEKLIELFQTEKGAPKKLAGFALARMDCGEAGDFWLSSEKTKKQALQYAALSKTAAMSRIVAEALGKCLAPYEADPAAHMGREELEELQSLLYLLHGKFGPEICQIYRRMADLGTVLDLKPNPMPSKDQPKARFKPTDIGTPQRFSEAVPQLLRRTIIYNPAPDLLALAEELQGESAAYAAAGIVSALLTRSAEEAWNRAKSLFRLPPKLYGVPKEQVLTDALECVYWDEALHRTCLRAALSEPAVPGSAPARGNYIRFRRPLAQEPDRRWYDALFSGSWGGRLSSFLYNMTPLDDPELRERSGAYYYKMCLRTDKINLYDLQYLCRLGWRKCEGLAVKYCGQVQKSSGHVPLWSIQQFLSLLPGSREAKQAEGWAVYKKFERSEFVLRNSPQTMELLRDTIEKLTDAPPAGAQDGLDTRDSIPYTE